MKTKISMAPFHFLMIVLAITMFTSSCNNQNKQQKLAADLQEKLDSITLQGKVPGINLSVLFDNGQEILLSAGFSDLENKTPMRANQAMFSGSVGKTYVSATVLKLHEQGKINLQAKAREYLKDESWFDSIPNAQDFTIEMLMNHTAGVPEYVYFPEIWDKIHENPDKVWTPRERLSVIFNKPASNPAGQAWNYADSHYIILGLIIEKIAGQSYYQVLDQYILKPNQLDNTYFSDKREFENLPAGYTSLSDDLKIPVKVSAEGVYCFNPQLEWTGGGLVSTVSDLTKWASLLYGGKLLKPNSMKLLVSPAKYETSLFENAQYGLGCFIGQTNGIEYLGHTGFVPGYLTYVQYIPDYKFALAMQVNSDRSHTGTDLKIFFNGLKARVVQEMDKE